MSAPEKTQNHAEEGQAAFEKRGWLTCIPAEFARALQARMRWHEVAPGGRIVEAGDESGGLVGIARGTAEISAGAGPADIGMLHIHHAGSWLGYLPLLGYPRTITLVARTPVLVAHVARDLVLHLLDEQPRWWRHIAELAAVDMVLAIGAAADLALRDPSRRVAAVLLRLAGSRHEDALDDESCVVRVTQDELAQMAASTRSTVNTLLQAYAAEGAVRLGYRDITVVNPGMLRARVDSLK